MKTSSRIVSLLLALCFLCACSVSKTTEIASAAANKFFQQFRDSRFQEIYADSSPAFKRTHAETEWISSMSAARTRLGNLRNAKRTSWVIDDGNKGEQATLRYSIEFENGSATARLNYEVSGGQAQLLDYGLTSPLLPAK